MIDAPPRKVCTAGLGWSVGQFEQGRAAIELLLPIVELRLQYRALQPLSLPVGKVGVLDRELGQRRRAFHYRYAWYSAAISRISIPADQPSDTM